MHVRIELFGGPEDGREITLPIGTGGTPMSPLPVPSTHREEEADGSTRYEVAWYDKQHCRAGVWIYKYTTAQTVHQSPTS